MPDDDYHVEPVRGLPQSLPEGEELLWQGAPSTWALARDALLILLEISPISPALIN